MDDLEMLVRSASSEPTGPLDWDAVQRRGQRLSARRRVAGASGLLMAVVVVASLAFVVRSSGAPDADDSSRSPALSAVPPTQTPYSPKTGGEPVQPAATASVALPRGWHRATTALAPFLDDPHEIGSFASFPVQGTNTESPACDAQVPKAAVDAMSATDAYIWLVESWTNGRSPASADPNRFPPRPGQFAFDMFRRLDCAATIGSKPAGSFGVFWWTEGGRVFGAYVVLGIDASPKRRQEALDVLNSLQVR